MTSTSIKGYNSYELLISEDCNLRCKYCFDDQFHDRSKTEEFSRPALMSLDLIEPLLEFVVKTKNPSIPPRFQFFGGEPLMNYKFIKEFVKQSREVLGPKVGFGIGTNGTLLNREKIDFFLENRIKINFSVDGRRDTHDKNRIYPGGKGSWENAIKYIPELIAKTKGTGIMPGANYTVEAEDVDKLEENYRFISNLTEGNGQILWNFQSGWNDDSLNKLKEIWDNLFLHGNIKLPVQYERRIMTPSHTNCHTTENSVTISSDGGMYFCHRLTPKMYEDNTGFKMGDIFKGVDNQKLVDDYSFRTDFKSYSLNSKCKDCEVKHPCYGGCHASHKYNTGNLMEIDDAVMCKIYKIIYNLPLQEKIKMLGGSQNRQQCQTC